MKSRNTKIRILYLHETVQTGGAEISLMNLLKNIDKTIFEPVFVLPKEGRFSAVLNALGVRVAFLPMPPFRRLAGVVQAIKRLGGLIDSEEIQIVHSNSIRTHMYGAFAARRRKVPIIWHQRNLIVNELFDPDRLFSFLPDRIICNSKAVAGRFLEWGELPSKVRVIYNGVDTEAFKPDAVSAQAIRKELGIRPDEVVVTIASRFDKRKGHEVFFKAAAIVLNSMPKAARSLRFLVVGGVVFDEDRCRLLRLKEMAKKEKIDDRMIFTPFRDDMPAVYAASGIVVLPSVAEACSRVVLEAMACAKPVVAANSGGTPEMVADNDTGYLVDVGDPGTLARKIALLAGDGALAAKMGAAGRERVIENFTIEKNVKEIQKVYLELAVK
jgi:L-malate glycosyltransferase